MRLFKRLSATLVSRVDQLVGEIENHDAVIQASLNDMRKKVAEAKVYLAQVRSEEQQLKQQIQEQQKNSQLWRKRAVECAKNDEAKALECVSRSRNCQQKVKRLELTLAQYTQTADKLVRDLEASEQDLTAMKQKLTLMRARQSTSLALNAANETKTESANTLEDSFNRWEINISQAEMANEILDTSDAMEHDFITQEQQAELKKELAALLAEEKQE